MAVADRLHPVDVFSPGPALAEPVQPEELADPRAVEADGRVPDDLLGGDHLLAARDLDATREALAVAA